MSLHPSYLPESLDLRCPTWRRVLDLAWPVWTQQLLLMAVGLWDQYLAGNNPPADPSQHVTYQSAQTTANYIAWNISVLTVLVSVGSTAMVARFVGARDLLWANRVMHQSIGLAVVVGLGGTLVGLLTIHDAVRLLRLEPQAARIAADFLTPILLLLTFQVLESAGIACLVGAGDTKTGLWIVGGVAVLNLPLAWICFHGLGPIPGLGFVGIATGTALSHAAGGIAVCWVLGRGQAGLKLHLWQLKPDFALIRRLLRISVPASIDTLSVALCQLWFLSLVNQLGNVAATAHGIAIRWESLGYMSGHAFATAAAALVGQHLGAKRPAEAAHSGWIALGMGGTVMVLMGAIFFALAPAMFRLFCPYPNQQPVIDAGVPALRLVAFAMPALAATIVLTGALRGAGDTRVPVLFTWTGFLLVRIPLAYLLTADAVDLGPLGTLPGWNFGLLGAWMAMFADLMLRGGLFIARFARGKWKATRV